MHIYNIMTEATTNYSICIFTCKPELHINVDIDLNFSHVFVSFDTRMCDRYTPLVNTVCLSGTIK